MIIEKEQFEKMVAEAIDELPEMFLAHINNLAIMVENFPNGEQMAKQKVKDKYGLLGLYEGHVQSRRLNFGMVLPDKITIFRMPICQSCSTEEACRQRIKDTVKHEIAHHFGSGEKGARKAGKRKTLI
jgi:predicted Zn-dependent protease with MMP-like domain